MIFGAIPPPRNFAKIRTRGGRGLQPVQPKDSIPPWGTHRNAAGAARRLCRSQEGGGALAAVCLGGRGASFRRGGAGKAQCRGAAGASGARGAGAFLPGGGGKPGAGGLGRVRRTKAAWRARRRGQNGCTQRGLCRVSGHLCDRGGSAGEKARFCLIRKRFFSGRGSCQIRAVLRPNPCRFGRVAFSAARSDECVTPGGAGEKPRRKTKRPSERSTPHEKPDFRYRD